MQSTCLASRMRKLQSQMNTSRICFEQIIYRWRIYTCPSLANRESISESGSSSSSSTCRSSGAPRYIPKQHCLPCNLLDPIGQLITFEDNRTRWQSFERIDQRDVPNRTAITAQLDGRSAPFYQDLHSTYQRGKSAGRTMDL